MNVEHELCPIPESILKVIESCLSDLQLKQYQKIAVDKLLSRSKILLSKEGQRVCVFKAPTGSGKTIIIAELLKT